MQRRATGNAPTKGARCNPGEQPHLPGMGGGRGGRKPRVLDFLGILQTFLEHGVEFVVVGGLGATLHGANYNTKDVDVLHRRTPENVERVMAALHELKAVYRLDSRYLSPGREGLLGLGSHNLWTLKGDLDMLGKIAPGMTYDLVADDAVPMEIKGMSLRVLPLELIILSKKAVSRDKDIAVLPILRATVVEIRKRCRPR